MPVVEIEAGQLLKAVEQMPRRELDQFVEKVVALRTSHRASRLSRVESELLTKINRGVPTELQCRYDELIAKRREGNLTQTEYDELLQLTEQVEGLDAKRVEYLADLARLRETTLPDLMDDLGIKPPPHV